MDIYTRLDMLLLQAAYAHQEAKAAYLAQIPRTDASIIAAAQQQQVVEQLKQDYAALSYTAVASVAEPHQGDVFVRGAEVLGTAYPEHMLGEALLLRRGFQRHVLQQTELARTAQSDLEHIAEALVAAQASLLMLQQQAKADRADLAQLKQEHEEAAAAWKLLLQAKQWSRPRW
jgi:hypothetical protein